ADLTNTRDVETVERRLQEDARIGILINNAGTTLPGTFVEQTGADLARLIALNVTAVTRLAHAAALRFAREGRGSIVNIGSVVGLAPELGWSVYGATKSFVQFLTQSLHTELAAKGVYLQAVLPSVTRTEIWDRAGKDVATLPAVMEVGDLVDAALIGFDRRELITIPPLPDDAQFTAMEAARTAMIPNFMQANAAARYRAA
ncbi:SDR family NAD(P)-dependent oxidoreductase, partial [Dongia sp.]|uniref:SDR family NAD(P)-dependent oxidoreductase n=1 Tax=Dongia sp. TaxID=1977262 RepID=UPI0035AE4788